MAVSSKARRTAALLAATMLVSVVPAWAQGTAPAEKSPPPAWTKQRVAPKGAPNIIVIMTDDVGFGASSTFGGPIPTPTFQALADAGVRYNKFHVTSVCSPTRAALLTGRNHNAVNMGSVADLPAPSEGYTAIIPKTAATMAEVLRQNGYATGMIGKSHLTPAWETGPNGPFDRWPTGLGFDYYYGFIVAETDQFTPALYEGTRPIDPPRSPDYILDHDLADRAIDWIRKSRSVQPDKPFFLYYATGTMHTPLQAPAGWIARFKGKFDGGWDVMREETLKRQIRLGIVPPGTKLAPMPFGIPSWKSLSAGQRAHYARQMEVAAAMLAYADDQIGRVLAEVRAQGQAENTMVIYIQGDNGASGEGTLQGLMNHNDGYNDFQESEADAMKRSAAFGGPTVSGHYAAGWASALNAPFPWMKQYASHLGGTRDGMVISWPARIRTKGEIRSQYHHVVDIYPTVLAAAGIPIPDSVNGVEQQRVDGVDMTYSFRDAKAPSTHRTQYYNMFGNAAYYADGWLASTTPINLPWKSLTVATDVPFAERKWELYNLNKDFSQTDDISGRYPEKLAELKAAFAVEARRNNVIPGYRGGSFFSWDPDHEKPQSFTYYGRMSHIEMPVAPDLLARSFTIRADIDVGDDARGVIVTQGGRFGGYSLAMVDGRPGFFYNAGGAGQFEILANRGVPAGKHVLEAKFAYDGGGRGKGGTLTLNVDGVRVAEGRIEKTLPILISVDERFDIGSDSGSAVTEHYAAPYAFSGEIGAIRIDTGPLDAGHASDARAGK